MKNHKTPLTLGAERRGFTLLYAVLISSILLVIGVAIFELTVRELKLSGIVRESQYAFYMADSGIECALYYDKAGVFNPGTPTTITCQGVSIANVGGTAYDTPSVFTADLPVTLGTAGQTRCVSVSVTKTQLSGGGGGVTPIRTVVESRGYNTTCASIVGNPGSVERALRVSF